MSDYPYGLEFTEIHVFCVSHFLDTATIQSHVCRPLTFVTTNPGVLRHVLLLKSKLGATLASVHFDNASKYFQTLSSICSAHPNHLVHHHPKSRRFVPSSHQAPLLHYHTCAFAAFSLLLYFYYPSKTTSSVKSTNPNFGNHFKSNTITFPSPNTFEPYPQVPSIQPFT